MQNHEYFIKEVLKIARRAYENGDEPFGAILVKDNEIVFKSENRIVKSKDPTQHAELALISDFCSTNKINDLSEYTMYTSTEPCLMCSTAIVYSKLKRLVYSANSSDLSEILKIPQYSSSEVAFKYTNYDIEVIKNVLNEEGISVLKLYF